MLMERIETPLDEDGAELRARIAFATAGLDLALDAAALERELRRAVRAGIAPADRRRLVVLNARALVERDSDYSRFAGRIQLTYIYEEVLGWDIERDGVGRAAGRPPARLQEIPRARRRDQAPQPAAAGVRPRPKLAAALDPSADLEFDFLGIQTIYDRYLHHRQDRRSRRAASRRRSSSGCASRWASASTSRATARRASPASTALQEPPLLPQHADAVQLRHAPLAALLLLPLLRRRLAREASCSAASRTTRSSQVGGRPRRLVDRGARHRRATSTAPTARSRASSRSSSCTTTSSSPSTRAASARARAARIWKPGTTTSSSSSSCARTPATSAAARTT